VRDPVMGEVGRGRMDEGRRHYGGPCLPGDQQGGARLGRRDVTQGALGCRSGSGVFPGNSYPPPR
jgi:hypothetical protein